jgi:hypothetical protein
MNPLAVCSAATVLATGCQTAATSSTSAPAARLDAYATVARRVYATERRGPPVRASLRRIARDGAAMRGDRAELLRQLYLPGYHVVRLRVVRSGRVVGDVGGRFVVAGASRGGLTISIQDAIGYVKLVRRLTGQGVVVRGRRGHVAASSPALSRVALPASGSVVVGGRAYLVSSFVEPGFAGERLRVWLLGQPT